MVRKGTKTGKDLCSQVCGARCCKWGFVPLSKDEAEALRKAASRLGLPSPEIYVYNVGPPQGDSSEEELLDYVMHATSCVFLDDRNLCLIYKNRPQHCRAFPDQARYWCPLSRRLYPSPSGTLGLPWW